jgi:prepilin-type N-terminal cleavage/methylation domain-containing protein
MAHSLLMTRRVRSRLRLARHTQRGFTLVEMAIVVVIIGILSVLAVVGYRKLIISSNMSEATHMVNAIRVAQEAYHAETQLYASPSSGLGVGGGLYPTNNDPPGAHKTGWGETTALGNKWAVLPVHADGAVMYGYATIGGAAGSTTSFSSVAAAPPTVNGASTGLTFPATTTTDWYVITAFGDPDGNSFYSAVIGTSWTNDLFTYNEGD